ncbi:MAG: cbb3-type cytochrome oxidase assembly protein CcoS [Bacteroidetes bacterium]|nr:cbb3-type cytochrome oxidase assembly protein CcoS [Bacteroidota bacterium]
MIIVAALILISLIIAFVFLFLFFWNIRTGQYEDTYTPSVRMLFDDEIKKDTEATNTD